MSDQTCRIEASSNIIAPWASTGTDGANEGMAAYLRERVRETGFDVRRNGQTVVEKAAGGTAELDGRALVDRRFDGEW